MDSISTVRGTMTSGRSQESMWRELNESTYPPELISYIEEHTKTWPIREWIPQGGLKRLANAVTVASPGPREVDEEQWPKIERLILRPGFWFRNIQIRLKNLYRNLEEIIIEINPHEHACIVMDEVPETLKSISVKTLGKGDAPDKYKNSIENGIRTIVVDSRPYDLELRFPATSVITVTLEEKAWKILKK